jgi:hypothetical protein
MKYCNVMTDYYSVLKEGCPAIWDDMDETRGHFAEGNKAGTDKYCTLSHL